MPDQAQKVPPIIENVAAPRSNAPTITVLVLALAILAARLSEHLHIPFLRCTFKAMTGLPCATCGGTRAFRSLSRFDVAQAFLWNPLVITAAFAVLAWFLLSFTFPEPIHKFKARASSWPLMKLGILLAILNWIYLLVFLPR